MSRTTNTAKPKVDTKEKEKQQEKTVNNGTVVKSSVQEKKSNCYSSGT